MDAKARAILAVLMTSGRRRPSSRAYAVMVFMVTLIATYLNLGFDPGFLQQWAKAYLVAWPVAATTAFFVMPPARHLTDRIMTLIDGRS
jgi:hypothetical protein